MARQEGDILDRAIRTIAEQAAKADALVDKALDSVVEKEEKP